MKGPAPDWNGTLHGRWAGAAAVVLVLATAACANGGPGSEGPGYPPEIAEARRHLDEIASGGPRPSGSEANGAAVRYLVDNLAEWGWEVTLQEGIGTSRRAATSGWVRNVVGWLPAASGTGDARDAVMLAAHHDSVVDGPGAMDNAASVAALLVAARQLAESPRRARPAILLLTDGEERYLLGADLFVRESPLAERVAAIVNLDHSGRGGPLFAFELSNPNRGLLAALRAISPSARNLRAYSFAADIYRVLPFDTDFTVLRTLGAPGINLAFAGDGYAYHTRLDAPPGVSDESLATLVRTVGGLARRLVVEGAELGDAGEADGYAVFVTIERFMVALGPSTLWGLALVLLLLSSIQIVGALRRGGRGVLRCWLAIGLALPLSIAALTGVVAGLRAAKGQTQVAYAHPWPFLALLAVVAFAVLLITGRLAGRHTAEAPTCLSAVTGLWALLTAAAVALTPGSSAFFLVPLGGLLAAAALPRRGSGPRATLAAATIAVASVLLSWSGPLTALLPFLMTTVPKMGPEPLLLWPLAIGCLTTLLGTVPWAFLGSGRSRRLTLIGAAGGAAAALAGVLLLPPYDARHPQRAWRYHVTGPSESYEVLASVDRLDEAAAQRGAGPDLADLFWLDPGWWRSVRGSDLAGSLPGAHVERSGEGFIVDVDPPPGADTVLLRLPRAGIEATVPPAEPQGRGQLVLRWVVAGGRKARFEVQGRFAEEVQARVMSLMPRVPAELSATPRLLGSSYVVGERAIAFVDVVLPGGPAPEGGLAARAGGHAAGAVP